MVITVEGTYTSTSVKTITSDITSVTIPAGLNRAIYIFLSHHQKAPNTGKYATGVMYDPALLQQSFELVGREEHNEEVVEIWRLLSPSVASNKIIRITWVDNNANWDGSCHAAVVLSGVDPDTPNGPFERWSSTSTSGAVTISPTSIGDLCYGVISVDNQDPTEAGDGTSQWNLHNDMSYGDGVSYTSTDTSTDFLFNFTNADFAIAGISINPAGPSDTTDYKDITLKTSLE